MRHCFSCYKKLEIVRALEKNLNHTQVAEQFGVSHSVVMDDDDDRRLLDIIGDVQALNDYLHGSSSKSIEEDDLASAAFGSANSLFASSTSAGPPILKDVSNHLGGPAEVGLQLSSSLQFLEDELGGASPPMGGELGEEQPFDILQKSLQEANITEQTLAQEAFLESSSLGPGQPFPQQLGLSHLPLLQQPTGGHFPNMQPHGFIQQVHPQHLRNGHPAGHIQLLGSFNTQPPMMTINNLERPQIILKSGQPSSPGMGSGLLVQRQPSSSSAGCVPMFSRSVGTQLAMPFKGCGRQTPLPLQNIIIQRDPSQSLGGNAAMAANQSQKGPISIQPKPLQVGHQTVYSVNSMGIQSQQQQQGSPYVSDSSPQAGQQQQQMTVDIASHPGLRKATPGHQGINHSASSIVIHSPMGGQHQQLQQQPHLSQNQFLLPTSLSVTPSSMGHSVQALNGQILHTQQGQLLSNNADSAFSNQTSANPSYSGSILANHNAAVQLVSGQSFAAPGGQFLVNQQLQQVSPTVLHLSPSQGNMPTARAGFPMSGQPGSVMVQGVQIQNRFAVMNSTGSMHTGYGAQSQPGVQGGTAQQALQQQIQVRQQVPVSMGHRFLIPVSQASSTSALHVGNQVAQQQHFETQQFGQNQAECCPARRHCVLGAGDVVPGCVLGAGVVVPGCVLGAGVVVPGCVLGAGVVVPGCVLVVLCIEEDDLASAAFGSANSLFASSTSAGPPILKDVSNHLGGPAEVGLQLSSSLQFLEDELGGASPPMGGELGEEQPFDILQKSLQEANITEQTLAQEAFLESSSLGPGQPFPQQLGLSHLPLLQQPTGGHFPNMQPHGFIQQVHPQHLRNGHPAGHIQLLGSFNTQPPMMTINNLERPQIILKSGQPSSPGMGSGLLVQRQPSSSSAGCVPMFSRSVGTQLAMPFKGCGRQTPLPLQNIIIQRDPSQSLGGNAAMAANQSQKGPISIQPKPLQVGHQTVYSVNSMGIQSQQQQQGSPYVSDSSPQAGQQQQQMTVDIASHPGLRKATPGHQGINHSASSIVIHSPMGGQHQQLQQQPHLSQNQFLLPTSLSVTPSSMGHSVQALNGQILHTQQGQLLSNNADSAFSNQTSANPSYSGSILANHNAAVQLVSGQSFAAPGGQFLVNQQLQQVSPTVLHLSPSQGNMPTARAGFPMSGQPGSVMVQGVQIQNRFAVMNSTGSMHTGYGAQSQPGVQGGTAQQALQQQIQVRQQVPVSMGHRFLIPVSQASSTSALHVGNQVAQQQHFETQQFGQNQAECCPARRHCVLGAGDVVPGCVLGAGVVVPGCVLGAGVVVPGCVLGAGVVVPGCVLGAGVVVPGCVLGAGVVVPGCVLGAGVVVPGCVLGAGVVVPGCVLGAGVVVPGCVLGAGVVVPGCVLQLILFGGLVLCWVEECWMLSILQQLHKNQTCVHAADRSPFTCVDEAIHRLLPYHVFQGSLPSQEEFTKVDDEFEAVSTQLLKRTQAMLNKYRRLLLEESKRLNPSSEMVMVDREFNQEERATLTRGKRLSLMDPDGFLEDFCCLAKPAEQSAGEEPAPPDLAVSSPGCASPSQARLPGLRAEPRGSSPAPRSSLQCEAAGSPEQTRKDSQTAKPSETLPKGPGGEAPPQQEVSLNQHLETAIKSILDLKKNQRLPLSSNKSNNNNNINNNNNNNNSSTATPPAPPAPPPPISTAQPSSTSAEPPAGRRSDKPLTPRAGQGAADTDSALEAAVNSILEC
ncbi:GLTSCR1-like protein [Acipenser ruthenus]|uniref:GLTSCR1-like protein n=1 Tax=Acipenser ruthenus TaxID=7906 RepID=A0A662YYV8_ACIRT|nr:GLTSCR1-like protein [Acipenser ruthenus]